MNRPLPKIDALSDDQRQQLADWLDTFTLDKCVELVKEKFGSEICRSTLNRYRKRCEHIAYLDTSPDSARARAEIINAAASGKPNFSQATVDLLEKQAFELAHDTRDPQAVCALKDLFGLVLKYENTSVRKRMATVQEGKLKLRQQQFDNANNHDTDAKIQDLNKKIAQAFDQHPVLTAIRNAEESALPSDVNPNPTLNPNPNLSTDRNPLSETLSSEPQDAAPPPPSPVAAPRESAALINRGNNPLITSAKSEIALASTVYDYTLRRAHEYWSWRYAVAALPDGQPHPPYTTEHRHCPCGKPCPCPDHEGEPHGEFPTYFWSTSPHLHAYEICLTTRNLPYRDPHECVPKEFRIYPRKNHYYD